MAFVFHAMRRARASFSRVSAAALEKFADLEVEVQGHTDSRGSDLYNKRLSQRRAQAVVDYLVRKDVDRDRLEAHGYGEEKPIAPNSTKTGRAMNRRVELIVRRRSGP